MKKLTVLAAAAMLAALPATGVSAAGDLTFATGGSSGTYYAFGSVLAGEVSSDTDTKVTAVESNGSADNVDQVDAGDADIAFCQSDVMAYAHDGINLFEGDPIDSFSTVAALYQEQVQIITTNPDIKTVADLKGKNVSIGASGSGVYFNAIDLLNAYGLTEEDINPTYESFADSADSLKDGKIDAAFITAGAPTTAVTDLSTAKDVYLVSIDDEHMKTLLEECPYYTENTISADTYGLDEDVKTVAVGAVVIASNDVAEDDIYNFVSAVFENTDAIETAHAKGAELDLDYAASITSVPYHAGAAKYFEEKGLTVETE